MLLLSRRNIEQHRFLNSTKVSFELTVLIAWTESTGHALKNKGSSMALCMNFGLRSYLEQKTFSYSII